MRPSFEEHRARVNDRRPGAWPRLQYEAMQTGRTTRMMREVLRLAAENEGRRVIVIVPSEDYGRELKRKFNTPDNVAFSSFNSTRNALFVDKLGRDDLGMIIRVDHAAVEQHLGHWLQELHRYDGTITNNEADKFGNHTG